MVDMSLIHVKLITTNMGHLEVMIACMIVEKDLLQIQA